MTSKLFLITLLLLFLSPDSLARNRGEIKKEILKGKKRLEDIRGRIEEEKREIEEARLREKELLKELNNREISLDRRRREALETEKKLAAIEKEIERKTERIKRLEEERTVKKERLKKRVVALYKFGVTGPAKVVFSSDSYMALLKRYRYMQLILEQDAAMIEGYRTYMAELNTGLARLEKDREETRKLKKELTAKKEAAERALRKKQRFLISINRSKRLHKKALKELEESSLELGKMIDGLEDSLVPEGSIGDRGAFSSFKGLLDFPANGDIIAFFGKIRDPRFNTTIFQKGIEIAAPMGADIKAIFDGKVLYADWFRGYGKIIIIDHGEGYYSLSAHASDIKKKVGQEVKRGEVVALAGDTGSLKGPYLYFEIRHKGKPVDPLIWLKVPPARATKTSETGREG